LPEACAPGRELEDEMPLKKTSGLERVRKRHTAQLINCQCARAGSRNKYRKYLHRSGIADGSIELIRAAWPIRYRANATPVLVDVPPDPIALTAAT
jgi:hypothetical protein